MNIDLLISLMDNIANSSTKDEFSEEDTGGSTSADAGTAFPDYPTVTPWESGAGRGAGNQIKDNTKWRDSYKITRGKANTLL